MKVILVSDCIPADRPNPERRMTCRLVRTASWRQPPLAVGTGSPVAAYAHKTLNTASNGRELVLRRSRRDGPSLIRVYWSTHLWRAMGTFSRKSATAQKPSSIRLMTRATRQPVISALRSAVMLSRREPKIALRITERAFAELAPAAWRCRPQSAWPHPS
jgi:hypothetical protein